MMFVTKNRQKLHRYDELRERDVFEVLGRCSLRVMTPESAYCRLRLLKRRWQVNFCGHGAPRLSRSVSDLAQRLLSILYFIIYYFLGVTMHYNAFLAVLFLRVVLYGPQNLVSFKKFPFTDGLGSTETATSCTATQVIPFEKYE